MKYLLTLLTLFCIAAHAEDFLDFDEFGNPIESTEIPADQIPPESRPPIDATLSVVRITKDLDTAILIETKLVNKVISVTPTMRLLLYDNPASLDIPLLANSQSNTLFTSALTSNALSKSIKSAETGIADYVKFIDTAHPRNYISDRRTLDHMPTIQDSDAWRKWQSIFNAEYPPIQHVAIPDITQVKMITEMRVAENVDAYNNLVSELRYFRTLEYNTVLAVWEGHRLSDLVQQIALAKSMGYKVYFSYGKREDLKDEVFMNPDEYKIGLESLASVCDGYIVGWRRTSLHLLKKQEQWIAYSMQCVRSGNPNIPIFGECYYGFQGNFNADGTPKEDEFRINVPASASGALVVNLGFSGVRPEGVLKLVRAETSVPLINLIVGERPYYMTSNANLLSKSQNRQIISGIETRFRKYDFGTATLAGDGSNEIYDKNVSDDLCKSQWYK